MRDDVRLSAPDTKIGRLQRDCLDLLREHNRKGEIPTNGRFLFYELEQRGVIPKKYDGINPKTGNKFARTPLQDVSVATMHLRESGLIPCTGSRMRAANCTNGAMPIPSSTI